MNQNKADSRKKGNEGENFAAQTLEKDGYTLLCRNYTCKGGEIDIIASKQSFLCFVEVKMRSVESGESASLSVDEKKLSRIECAIDSFLNEYRDNEYICSLTPRTDIFEIYTRIGRIVKHNHIIGIN